MARVTELDAIGRGPPLSAQVIVSVAANIVVVCGVLSLGGYLVIKTLRLAVPTCFLRASLLVRAAIGPALLTPIRRWNGWPRVRTDPHA